MKEQGKSGSVAEAGTLYVVATPIGNLEDMTLRALRILESVDTIAAEDTRHTRRLLTHHGISKPLISYHDHNKVRQAPRLLEMLQAEQSVALVTDAGTPGISDPAYYLIQLLLPEDIPIVPIPGPTAVIAALSVAGLPTD
ncbi:MAG: rRNA small subunit methyltransferase 1, partial [Candidatus Tectomicrobia bacterium]|nr:rRNA small subunit methyltransferase 1 [Candidatus Tectomicrobia bacterium]